MSSDLEVLFEGRFKASQALPVDEFREIVRSECRRTDRGGFPCSVVCFRVVRSEIGHIAERRMARLLNERMRRTDLVGWWDEASLCALLADTGLGGAADFAASVGAMLTEVYPSISHTLYAYPVRWFEEETDQVLSARVVRGAPAPVHTFHADQVADPPAAQKSAAALQ